MVPGQDRWREAEGVKKGLAARENFRTLRALFRACFAIHPNQTC